jgi:hypothetical protein
MDETPDRPAENWDGEWSELPAPKGGSVFTILGDEVLSSGHLPSGSEVPTVRTATAEWVGPDASVLASGLSMRSQPLYAETDDTRYLAVQDGTQMGAVSGSLEGGSLEPTNIFDSFQRLTALDSVGGQLVASTFGGVHLRTDQGSWKDISPEQSGPPVSDVSVVGDTIFAELSSGNAFLVSTDAGQSWSEPSGIENVRPRFDAAVSTEDGIVALGTSPPIDAAESDAASSLLLESSDGVSWTSTQLEVTQPLAPGSLTELQGSLYSLDKSSQLVRVSPEDASTEFVIDSDIRISSDQASLYASGSTLLLSANVNDGAILTWKPGTDGWSMAPLVSESSALRGVVNGTLWAETGVWQTLGESSAAWKPAQVDNRRNLWVTSKYALALDSSTDCLNAALEEHASEGLQWTNEGPSIGCDGAGSDGMLTDAVPYEQGFAVSRDSEVIQTGPTGPNEELSGTGGLVYWNTEAGEATSLVPESAQDSRRPAIWRVANAGGTLWVSTAEGDGLPGDEATLYQVEDGDWTAVDPAVIDTDGIRWEEGVEVFGSDLKGYGSTLITYVRYEVGEENSEMGAAVWNDDEGAFEILEPPSEDVVQMTYTQVAPVAASEDALWIYDVQGEEWIQVSTNLPVSGRDIDRVAAKTDAIYVNATDGDLWVTRATEEGR